MASHVLIIASTRVGAPPGHPEYASRMQHRLQAIVRAAKQCRQENPDSILVTGLMSVEQILAFNATASYNIPTDLSRAIERYWPASSWLSFYDEKLGDARRDDMTKFITEQAPQQGLSVKLCCLLDPRGNAIKEVEAFENTYGLPVARYFPTVVEQTPSGVVLHDETAPLVLAMASRKDTQHLHQSLTAAPVALDESPDTYASLVADMLKGATPGTTALMTQMVFACLGTHFKEDFPAVRAVLCPTSASLESAYVHDEWRFGPDAVTVM